MIQLPETAVLEITARCNHRCFFCSCPWEKNSFVIKEELDFRTWCKILDFLQRNGVKHVTFTGGEVTMRKDLFDLLDYAFEKKISFGVISNGLCIDDIFLERYSYYHKTLSISVPGIKTFAFHTGIDNIENVLKIFDKCCELNIPSVANIVVTKKNISELYENIAYPILHGANYILLNRFLPGGRGEMNTEYLLSKEEINTMLDVAEEVLSKAGISGHVGTELPLCVIKNPSNYHYLHVSTKCGAAKKFMAISPDGYVRACNHSPEKLCKWNEIETLKTNVTWNRYVKSEFIPQMCSACENLGECDGGCREAARVCFGDIGSKDPCFYF